MCQVNVTSNKVQASLLPNVVTTITSPTVPHPGSYQGPDNYHSSSLEEPTNPWSCGPWAGLAIPVLSPRLSLLSVSLVQATTTLLQSYYSGLPTGFPSSPPDPSCAPVQSVEAHCSQCELSKCKSDHSLLYFHSSEDKVRSPKEPAPTYSPASSYPPSYSLRKNGPSFSSLDVPCSFLSQYFYTHFYFCLEYPTHVHMHMHTHTHSP